MKIKGIIEDLNLKKNKKKERKNDRKNSKNISRTFSGVVGSVHFRLVPWSDIFLKIYRPLPM